MAVVMDDEKVEKRLEKEGNNADVAKFAQDTADENDYRIMVEPVEFGISCTSGDKTVEVSKFSAYVERLIEILEGIDPFKVTTGVILNPDGTFSHVPTAITMIDGKYYARINSLTNSAYLLIYSPKTFKDVENHGAGEDVNDMGSRLIVSGRNENEFAPDDDITRAEFTQIVVNALGLMRPGAGKNVFSDVSHGAWYCDAVSIANEYGLISCYGDGCFRPNAAISREEAMVIISRAMQITGLYANLSEDEINSVLEAFADTDRSAGYAKSSIAACIISGIVLGRSDSRLA